MKGKYAEGFNTQLINLFKELIKMYPKNKDFNQIKNQIMILSQTAYEIPIQTFELHVSIYRNHIQNKNDKFFMEFNLQGTPLSELDYLKNIWKIADTNTKDAMWRYFIILDKLSEKYNSL